MKDMLKKGKISMKNQKVYQSYLGFYFSVKLLRNMGLVEECGVNNNNEKFWRLTPKGVSFTNKLIEIEKIIGDLD